VTGKIIETGEQRGAKGEKEGFVRKEVGGEGESVLEVTHVESGHRGCGNFSMMTARRAA